MNLRIKLVFDILNRLKPQKIFSYYISLQDNELKVGKLSVKIPNKSKVHAVCLGKAASFHGIEWFHFSEKHLKGEQRGEIFVLTKEHHIQEHSSLQQWEAEHPVVGQKSLKATQELITRLQTLPAEDMLIVFLSGGTSALLESFVPYFSLAEMQEINQALLASGIAIEEMNLVRKSLSLVKNAGLIQYIPCKTITTLAVSDVPSNSFEAIGSAPTYFSALDIHTLINTLSKLELSPSLSKKLYHYYQSEEFFNKEENKQRAAENKRLSYAMLSDYFTMVEQIKKMLPEHSKLDVEKTIYSGLVDDRVALELSRIEKMQHQQVILLSGGEATVQVKKPGRGGRNTHYVLLLSQKIFFDNVLNFSQEQLEQCFIISVGTDGGDGATDCAGAWMNYEKYQHALSLDIQAREFSDRYDSYSFFEKLDCLIKTGATGTNIMDLRLTFLNDAT